MTFELDLGFAATVAADLRDFDNTVAIDTLLYIQGNCGAAMDLLGTHCSNDVLGEPRHSHIRTGLSAGTHFLTVDHANYTGGGYTWGCGVVRLVLSAY